MGNPPYNGARRIRNSLGDSYVDALRGAYPNVPDSADFVMYWCYKAVQLVATGATRRFGFITTKALIQDYSRPVLEKYIDHDKSLTIIMAIPDHPWVEEGDGAAVRVTMTVGARCNATNGKAMLGVVTHEDGNADNVQIEWRPVDSINSSLTAGVNTKAASPLRANLGLCYQGVVPAGDEFKLSPQELNELGVAQDSLPAYVKKYIIGRDLVQKPESKHIIDFYGLTDQEAASVFPLDYQRLLDTVYHQRKQNNRATYRDNW